MQVGEQLLQLLHCVLRILDTVTNGPGINIDFIIVATLVRLVTEEVNLGELHTLTPLLLGLHMAQAVCLIPSVGEHVERDLSANGVGETVVRELLFQSLDHLLSHMVLIVISVELVPLLRCRIPANRAHIDHSIPELDESTPLNRNIQISNVMQDPARQLLVLLLADPANEGGLWERDAHAEGGQTVFGEAEVEEGGYGYVGCAELFLLFGEVGTADVPNGDVVAEFGEELEHFGGGGLVERVNSIFFSRF